jgi:hypothetical protein
MLSCGLIGFFTFAFVFATVTLAAGEYTQQFNRATVTPTTSATNTNTPMLILSQPGNDNQPIGHPGTKVDITGQGFTPNSSVSLYTTIDPNQCTTGGGLTQFTSQPVETVQADGTFTLHTTWPKNASQPGTAYYVCAHSSTTAGEDAASAQTFSVARKVTVSASTNSVNPGDSITITGENWLPPLQVQVSVVASQGTGNAIASATATPDSNGHFSVNLTIDSNAQPGQYVISVAAPDEPTLANQATTITVASQATPTPAITPTPAPTPTPTPASNTGGSNGNGGVTILAFTLGGLGLLCVIVGGIMFAVSGPSSSRMQ